MTYMAFCTSDLYIDVNIKGKIRYRVRYIIEKHQKAVLATMSNLRELANRLSENVDLYEEALDKARCHPDDAKLSLLSSKELAAREEIIITAEKLLQQARGPAPALISLLESVILSCSYVSSCN
jgi:hypothetical protein